MPKGVRGDGTIPHGTENGYKHFLCRCEPCRAAHSVDTRTRKLRRQFNVTPEEYDRIVEHQGGVCAICQSPPRTGGLRLSLDHNHKTGLVRGAVCWLCNAGLAHVRDDPERVRRLLAYLESPPATTALGGERYGMLGRVTNSKAKYPRRAA